MTEPTREPFKPETWPLDADGFAANLCTACGTPVRYGSRHGHCTPERQAARKRLIMETLDDEPTMNVLPLPNRTIRSAADLSPWQDGATKPATNGEYLREFDEGEAISTFHDGKWLRDGFFESDVQDAPWRGLAA